MAFVVLFHQATVHRRLSTHVKPLFHSYLPRIVANHTTKFGGPLSGVNWQQHRCHKTPKSIKLSLPPFSFQTIKNLLKLHQKSPKSPILCFFVLREIGRQGFVGTKQTVSRIGTFNRGLCLLRAESLALSGKPRSYDGHKGWPFIVQSGKKPPIFLGSVMLIEKFAYVEFLGFLWLRFINSPLQSGCVYAFFLFCSIIDMFCKNPRFWGLDMWQPLGFLPVPHCPPWPLLARNGSESNQPSLGCAGTHATRHIFSGFKKWIHPWDDWIFRKSFRNGW